MTYCELCPKKLETRSDEYRIDEQDGKYKVVCVECFHKYHTRHLYEATPRRTANRGKP